MQQQAARPSNTSWALARWTGRIALAVVAGFVASFASVIFGPSPSAMIAAPIFAIAAGTWVFVRMRSLFGMPRRVPGAGVVARGFEVVSILVSIVVGILLSRDPRTETGQSVVLVAAVGVALIPMARRLGPSPGSWISHTISAMLLVACGIATYPIGGLGYLAPALLMGTAAVIGILGAQTGSRAPTPNLSLPDIPMPDRPLVRLAFTIHLVLTATVAIGRLGLAPAGSEELVGDLGWFGAYSMPAVLAWWSLDRRPRLLQAAGVLGIVQSFGWGWALLLVMLGVDPGPGNALSLVLIVPSALYFVAWSRARSAGRPGGSFGAALAVGLGIPPVVALQVTHDWGGGTDDFMSPHEGLAALALAILVLALTRVLTRPRDRTKHRLWDAK